MSFLEILHPGQPVEQHELSRSEPVLVGRLEYSTIRVDEEGVAPIQVRISWNKSVFEATSASADGVVVNNRRVSHARLTAGDEIRVGSCRLTFRSGEPVAADPVAAPPPFVRERKRAESARKPPEPERRVPPPVVDTDNSVDLPALPENPNFHGSKINTAKAADDPNYGKPKPRPKQRPGEQDFLRSPFVLGLGGGTLVLALATAAIWFLMGREAASQHYARGVAALDGGQYAVAIQTLDEFVERFPGSELKRKAVIAGGKARVLREIGGGSPNWQHGLEQLDVFIKLNRGTPEFAELEPDICFYAEQISVGAAKSAETARSEDPLKWSADAQAVLERHSDPQQPPAAALERIRVATVSARRAIVKQQTLDAALARMTAAIDGGQPLDVLAARIELLQRYPDLKTQPELLKRVAAALEQELAAVQIVTEEVEPAEPEPAGSSVALVPLPLARARTDEVSEGRRILAMSRGALYSVDSVTGEPSWRRLCGTTAFFPLRVTGATTGILACFEHDQSLRLLNEETGADLWRQKLGARPTGAPLVHGNQIYLSLDDRRLVRLELHSGRLSGALLLSQRPVATPCLSRDETTLFLPGDHSLIYAISLNPFQATALTFTQHASGSVVTPLLTMGRLLLQCENDRENSCRLRIWNAEKVDQPLQELSELRVSGTVRDLPVLRGPQLVVPLTNGRLEAFTVRDDTDKPGLVPIAAYQVPGTGDVPMQLTLGPDGQFWLASNAFRKFQLTADSIAMDQNSVATGLATQPLQSAGEDLFVARRPVWSQGVQLSRIDREKLSSPWRLTLGAGPLAVLPTAGGMSLLTENSELTTVSSERLRQGGLDFRSSKELEWSLVPSKGLHCAELPDGRCLVVVTGADSQSLLVMNAAGSVETRLTPPVPVDLVPVPYQGGLLMAAGGTLSWQALGSMERPPVDFALPVREGAVRRWSHVAVLDPQTALACDGTGECYAIEWVRSDVSHLAERAVLSLTQAPKLPPAGREGNWFLVDGTHRLVKVTADRLELTAERTFEAGVVLVTTTAQGALVQTDDGKLHALPLTGTKLDSLWSTDLAEMRLLPEVLQREGLLMAAGVRGEIVLLHAHDGSLHSRRALPQRLARLVAIHDIPIAIAEDGSLYPLEWPAGGQP